MDKKQYEKIERYIPQFQLAESNFVRVSRSDLESIRVSYNELTNKNLQAASLNCTHCVLKMMKEMNQLVKQYEAWREKISGADWKEKDAAKKDK